MTGRVCLLTMTLVLAAGVCCYAGDSGVYNVKDFGAVADGKQDDGGAIQKALDTAGSAGGGMIFLPTGNYLVKTHLNIPNHVTLSGVWEIPTAFSQMKGTTLLAVEGEGSIDGSPFIMLNLNSTLKGVSIYYPNQDEKNIKKYPWCIACGGGDNPSIIDVLMVNPYLGVDFATRPSGRHYIRNLYGQPMKIGISIDKCYDVGRIENVHFWPFWKGADVTGKEGVAMLFGRTDWQYVSNFFCWGYRTGLKFIKTEAGSCNGNFAGIGVDAAEHAVEIEECAPYGLLFTNGEFVSFLMGDDRVEIVTGPNYTGVAQFQNCAFWGSSKNIARLQGNGHTSFQNCNFMGWNETGQALPAIDSFGGQLIATGCNFVSVAPQLYLHEDVRKTIFSNNTCAGFRSITNHSQGQAILEPNLFDLPKGEEEDALIIDDTMLQGVSDAGSFEASAGWKTSPGEGNFLGGTHWAAKGAGAETARWRPTIHKKGKYEIFLWNAPDPNKDHASDVRYVIHHGPAGLLGRQTKASAIVDSTKDSAKWISLGIYPFNKGAGHYVEVSNKANGNVTADAMKFVPR